MLPFLYPDSPHIRRHGPSGYDSYESFRPWLRDEFLFRCVYCLKREQWGIVKNSYTLDHFLPHARFTKAVLDYENLLYSCATCNSAKGAEIVPHPCQCMLRDHVILHEDGSIEGEDDETRRLIRKLGLDDSEYREFRKLWIDIIAVARKHNKDLFRQLMKYPDNLPDLSTLRAPHNSRLEGVEESCYARRERGELPEVY